MCKEQFTSDRGLQKHTSRVHEGKKPFQCQDMYVIVVRNICQKFTIEITYPWSELEKKPFPCPQCGLQFYFSTRLKKHIPKSHKGKTLVNPNL